MTAPRIALLDNDPAVLSLLHQLLADEGYRTLRCRPDDVLSARALVRRARPALVILDLWFAKRDDGWAFLKQLWADVDTTNIPALILTGEPGLFPMHADILHAMRCQVVQKPFALQDLLEAIAALLGPSPVQRDGDPRLHALPTADSSVADRPNDLLAAGGEDV